MNENHPDILLSAYLDDEVTPAERAEVEELLETSAEARRELQELRTLRDVLQSMPRATLSDDFTAAVMRESERATLLPEPAKPAVEASPGSGRGRSRLVIFSSVVATAAVLVVMANLMDRPGGESTHDDASRRSSPEYAAKKSQNAMPAVASADESAKDRATEALAGEKHRAFKAETRGGFGKDVPRNSAATAPPPAAARLKQFKKAGGLAAPGKAPAVDSKLEKAKGLRSFGAGHPDGSKLRTEPEMPRDKVRRELLDKLNKGVIKIGDVIPYFENRGNQTAVIEVTVVDVQPAVNRLKLLLARQSVPATDPSTEEKKGDKGGKRRDAGLIAVYVESTSLQLSAAMSELAREVAPLQLTLKPPVELKEFLLADSRPGANAKSPAGSGPTLADAIERNRRLHAIRQKRSDTPPAAKSSIRRPGEKGKAVAQKKPVTKPNAAQPEKLSPRIAGSAKSQSGAAAGQQLARKNSKEPASFHFLLRVPPDVYAARGRQGDLRIARRRIAQKRSRDAKRLSVKNSTKPGKVGRSAELPGSPVRVIFIFRKQAAAPAPKPQRSRS